MTLPWNLQLGQCYFFNHCNHIIGWGLMKLDAITSASALDIWSCTRSLDLELYIASAPLITWTFHLTPHLELSPPINEIKYQSFLHHYSLTNTSWVRHPIQVSSSSFHTYLRSTNEFSPTFKVSPCWHCKYEFDIHSIFPRAIDEVTYIPYEFDIHSIFPRALMVIPS